MEWGLGCCCGCPVCISTVGFWGAYHQSQWKSGTDFPATWTKLTARDSTNLTNCNVLVIGQSNFGNTVCPTTSGDCAAVASWITGGGVLFVLHEYWGPPALWGDSASITLNSSLSLIGTQVRAGLTSGPTSTGPHTVTATNSHPLFCDVDKLSIAGPGYISSVSTSEPPLETLFSYSGAAIITIESFGSGFVVYCSDASMVNAFTAAQNVTSGNKINQFLHNLGCIATN